MKFYDRAALGLVYLLREYGSHHLMRHIIQALLIFAPLIVALLAQVDVFDFQAFKSLEQRGLHLLETLESRKIR